MNTTVEKDYAFETDKREYLSCNPFTRTIETKNDMIEITIEFGGNTLQSIGRNYFEAIRKLRNKFDEYYDANIKDIGGSLTNGKIEVRLKT